MVRTKTYHCRVVKMIVMASMTVPINLAMVAVGRNFQVGGDNRRMSVHHRMRHFRRHMRIGQAHLQGLEQELGNDQSA